MKLAEYVRHYPETTRLAVGSNPDLNLDPGSIFNVRQSYCARY